MPKGRNNFSDSKQLQINSEGLAALSLLHTAVQDLLSPPPIISRSHLKRRLTSPHPAFTPSKYLKTKHLTSHPSNSTAQQFYSLRPSLLLLTHEFLFCSVSFLLLPLCVFQFGEAGLAARHRNNDSMYDAGCEMESGSVGLLPKVPYLMYSH